MNLLPPGRLWHTLYEDSEPPLGPGEWNTHACSEHALGPLSGVVPCDCVPGTKVWCQRVIFGADFASEPALLISMACGWPGPMVLCKEGPVPV